MYDLVKPFFVTVSGTLLQQMYEAGQICLAPALYLIDKNPMHVLHSKYVKATAEHEHTLAWAGPINFNSMHEPDPILGTRSDEQAAVVRCKMRPVILLSPANDPWQDSRRRSDDCYLVAPVYRFGGDESKEAYTAEFVQRVQAYAYNTLFYLPANDKPNFLEGFVRFDRLQVVHRSWLTQRPIRLSEQALECLEAWLSVYVCPEMATLWCKDVGFHCMPNWLRFILDYRENMMKELGVGAP